jgi:hypothetical protein
MRIDQVRACGAASDDRVEMLQRFAPNLSDSVCGFRLDKPSGLIAERLPRTVQSLSLAGHTGCLQQVANMCADLVGREIW